MCLTQRTQAYKLSKLISDQAIKHWSSSSVNINLLPWDWNFSTKEFAVAWLWGCYHELFFRMQMGCFVCKVLINDFEELH